MLRPKCLAICLANRVNYLLRSNLVSRYQIKRNCLSSFSDLLELSFKLELKDISDAKNLVFFLISFELKIALKIKLHLIQKNTHAIFTASLKKY